MHSGCIAVLKDALFSPTVRVYKPQRYGVLDRWGKEFGLMPSDGGLRKKPAAPPPMGSRPFRAPPCQPSELRIRNMERLLALLLEELHEPEYDWLVYLTGNNPVDSIRLTT